VAPLGAVKVSGPHAGFIENVQIISGQEALRASTDLYSMGKIKSIRFDSGEVREIATIR
jgi:hypothetical protein